MSESRLSRWARRKAQTRSEAPPAEPAVVEPTAEEQELAINEALSEAEVLEKYDLPDPDNIALGEDITGFLKKEIPEFLRRRALRSLWKSNPVLAVLDGLNDYDEDFSNAATAMKGYQTIYKVGEGMVDRSKKAAEALEKAGEVLDSGEDETKVESIEAAAESQLDEAKQEPAQAAPVKTFTPEVTQLQPEDEPPPSPRFRPRMRFTS